MSDRRGKGGMKRKGTVRGMEERQGRVQQADWDRRDALCRRVDSGESVMMRVMVGGEAVVGRVTWIVYGAPDTADGSEGEWSRVNEVYMDDGSEEVSVILDRVHWGMVEVDDPEYPLESPEVSEDEGEGLFEGDGGSTDGGDIRGGEDGEEVCLVGEGGGQVDREDQGGVGAEMGGWGHSGGGLEEGIGESGDEYPMSPGLMEEACAMAPRGDMRFENQGKVFATLWEQFNWDTAVQMMGLMGDRMQDAAMCRAAARAVLVGEYGFTQRELEEPGKGGEYLRSFQLPMGAVREHEDFWRYSKEVDSLRRALAMMPRYLAAARRGLGGEAWVLVRYVRKALRSGEKYGRAYPSVIGGDGETVLRGVPSLTTMPREVRNALISFPRQTLLDFDLAKCYPSIMLAAARMHGFEEGAMALLEGFLADPKATMARIATEAKCDSGGAKQMINQIISDPRKRHHRSLGTWLGRFEEEIHGLRERLVDAHEEGVAFRDELRGDGSPPNMGTVVYRVLTDYEVRVIEVAAREFQKRGVRVGTYEYDGLKVEAEGWGKLGPRAQQWLLHEVTRQVDRLVFAGRSGGVMHLVQKEMGYEGYAQGLRLLGGAERGVVVQGGSSRSEGEGREADDDGGPQGVQEGAGEEGGLGPGCGSASGADDADGGEAGHGSKGPSHPRQCEEEGFTEGRGPGADFGDGEDTACSGGVDPESGGARCSYQGEMALTARESMGNGGEHAGKEGGGQRGAGEDGHKGSAGAGVVVGGGDCGDSGDSLLSASEWLQQVGPRRDGVGREEGVDPVGGHDALHGGGGQACGEGVVSALHLAGGGTRMGGVRGGSKEGAGQAGDQTRGAGQGSAQDRQQGGSGRTRAHTARAARGYNEWQGEGAGSVVHEEGSVRRRGSARGLHLHGLCGGDRGSSHAGGEALQGRAQVGAAGGHSGHCGGSGEVAAKQPSEGLHSVGAAEEQCPGGRPQDGGARAAHGGGGWLRLRAVSPQGVSSVDDHGRGRVRPEGDQGALPLLRDGDEAPAGDDTPQGQLAKQGEVGRVLHRCGQEQDACAAGGGARRGDGAGMGAQRLRPRVGGRVRRRAESEWDDVWVQVEGTVHLVTRTGGGHRSRVKWYGGLAGPAGCVARG